MHDPPDRDVLHGLHERLLHGDKVASEELSGLILPILVDEIGRKFPKTDEQAIADGVVDAVLEYCAHPTIFDVSKGIPLDRFLATAAWRNVSNLIVGEQRRKRRERVVGSMKREADVALDPPARKIKQEEEDDRDRRTAAMTEALVNTKDKELLRLKLDGVRDTAAFAQVLNITHLPAAKQREEVKRNKDRIVRFLRRKGLLQ